MTEQAGPMLHLPFNNDQLLEASIFLAMLAGIVWIAWSDRGLRMYHHSGWYGSDSGGDGGSGVSGGHGGGDCGGGDGCGH